MACINLLCSKNEVASIMLFTDGQANVGLTKTYAFSSPSSLLHLSFIFLSYLSLLALLPSSPNISFSPDIVKAIGVNVEKVDTAVSIFSFGYGRDHDENMLKYALYLSTSSSFSFSLSLSLSFSFPFVLFLFVFVSMIIYCLHYYYYYREIAEAGKGTHSDPSSRLSLPLSYICVC